MSDLISLIQIIEDTVVDGPGFRLSLYAAGCVHHCNGCHNPHSWEFKNGQLHSTDELMERICRSISNITFTGGDPFCQADAFAVLARKIKEKSDKTIWCYTGYQYETLLLNESHRNLLQYIDVLVDGPYIAERRNKNLMFRGSDNQRLIDVRQSLKEQQVVIYDYQPLPLF